MYIQWFVKGIGGPEFTKDHAFAVALLGNGIISNWWRNKPEGSISPPEVQAVLTEDNLNRHLHDYDAFGDESPFISLAAGAVERDTIVQRNFVYSAVDTALAFATDHGARDGALFYGWAPVALNPAVSLGSVSEEVRDLNVYRRWSPFQLEGEITAKVHIPANQICRVEWWEAHDRRAPVEACDNPGFVPPDPLLNMRELF
jgi:hypothetical protein